MTEDPPVPDRFETHGKTLEFSGDAPANGSSFVECDLFCPECSYNLRGLSDDRCPECGATFDRSTLHVWRIPWVHRKELGAFRAYWRTVWLVVLPGSPFYQEAARPVSYPDAQRFRWVTILHVLVPVCIAITLSFVVGAWHGDYVLDSVALHVAGWAGAQVGAFLVLTAITGVSSYFFHPRYLPIEVQNRTVAMSYYAFATWAWTPIAGVMMLMAMGLDEVGADPAASVVGLLAGGILVAEVLLCWFDLLHIANKSMGATPVRLTVMGVALPLSWLAVAIAIFGGIPLVVGYVTIIIASLADT